MPKKNYDAGDNDAAAGTQGVISKKGRNRPHATLGVPLQDKKGG